MNNDIDLNAYLARIGYSGPRVASLDTLCALHELHPAAIVFEAIDVLLGRGVDLAPAAVDSKLVTAGRGGYCFEHNQLFRRALTALGFEVQGLAARVRWMLPADAPATAQTHMALRVIVDGQAWLADVGFGGCVLTTPLRLHSTATQATRHEAFRLTPVQEGLLLQGQLGGDWAPLYELSLQPKFDIDYELGNWFTSTHPDSKFRRDLIVARTTVDARSTLLNNSLAVRRANGDTTQRRLSADEIEHELRVRFNLPVQPDWRTVIDKAAAAS